MPHIAISLAEGRTPEQLRGLLRAVHAAVEAELDAPAASIRVILTEVPRSHWLSGGETLAEKATRQSASPPVTDHGGRVPVP